MKSSLLGLSPFPLFTLIACSAGTTAPPPRDTGPDVVIDGANVTTDGGLLLPDAPAPDAPDASANDDVPTPPDGGCVAIDETCNGADDDCDDLVDESAGEVCGEDEGQCVAGTRACVDGMLAAVCAGAVEPSTEACNTVDDNCDGTIDERCFCTDGATQACGEAAGSCSRGMQTCAGGSWGVCVGEVGPTAEACNGADDDCDGTPDDGLGVGDACDGSDADECRDGVTICAMDGTISCGDDASSASESCEGTDDDCDGVVDEGCACMDGATQGCGDDTGECARGTQTCAGGRWGACSGAVEPVTETCNALDDDCDGTSDESFDVGDACDGPADRDRCLDGAFACASDGTVSCDDPGPSLVEACNGMDDDCNGAVDDGLGGMACDSAADADQCTDGMTRCDAAMGAIVCDDAGPDRVETCNGMDDDCDGAIDDGNPGGGAACDGPDADRCTDDVMTCTGGAVTCADAGPARPEICNGMDDDCDGQVDEGNPGGGVSCGPSLGGCATETSCESGVLVCRGTFVSPLGTAMGDGTQMDPLRSITAAIANAAAIGGGADVCVCDDAATPGASLFPESFTMVEGTSVLGGFRCSDWTRDITMYVTRVTATDDGGIFFPAAITSATVLDGMQAAGLTSSSVVTSAAITVGGAPILRDVTATSGNVPSAVALAVVGPSSAPRVERGRYTARASAGGNAVAVSINRGRGAFVNVEIGNDTATSSLGNTSTGVECNDCAGTTFEGGQVHGGRADTRSMGFKSVGDLTGFVVRGTTIHGGTSTNGIASSSAGVDLASCSGGPRFELGMSGSIFGGGGQLGTRVGLDAGGPMCDPVVTGGRVAGCEARSTMCIGVRCTGGQCRISGSNVEGASGRVDEPIGVEYRAGATGRIERSTIEAGGITALGPRGVGVRVEDASPVVDANVIRGPENATGTGSLLGGGYAAVQVFGATSALVTNNVIRDNAHLAGQVGLYYRPAALSAMTRPFSVVNNTIEIGTGVCTDRVGLGVDPPVGGAPGAYGVVHNNVVRLLRSCTGSIVALIAEGGPTAILELANNALDHPVGAPTILYADNGFAPISTITGVNALVGASANILADCGLDATWHITSASSPCVDVGAAARAPATDRDGGPRPNGLGFDIGADER